MDTLADLIGDAARRFGDRTALTLAQDGSDEHWTYDELYCYARRVAQMLSRRGIGPGDRVVMWAPNGPRWVGAFFGCVLNGVTIVPLDIKITADFVSKIAAQTEPRLVISSLNSRSTLESLGLPSQVIEDLDQSLADDDPGWKQQPIGPNDMVELVFTSGTTGAPKGVILSHRNILSDLEAAEQLLPPQPTYRMLSLLPLSHMFEQIAELFYVLSIGASVTYVDSLQPSTIFRAMREQQITAIPVVPQILTLFMSGIEREVKKSGKWQSWERAHRIAPRLPMSLRRLLFREVQQRLGGHLDFVVCGGAHLDAGLAQRWENLGIKVIIGYGTTEASPIIAMNSLKRRNLRSVGRPIASNEVRIAPDGEILVRGSNITRGYWRNEADTQAAFEDGWYRTGDLGFLSTDGDLYLKGRKKNMIVLSNGMKVYPEDVENTLREEAGLTDAVVIGRERDGNVELHGLLLLQDGADADNIVKRANQRLAAHQRLKGFTVWPDSDFPRTHTLKPKRDEMLRILADQDGTESSTAGEAVGATPA